MTIALVLHGEQFTMSLWLAIFSDVGVTLLAILNSLRIMRLFGRQSKIEQGELEEDE
jgi:cation transport ATPase